MTKLGLPHLSWRAGAAARWRLVYHGRRGNTVIDPTAQATGLGRALLAELH